MMDINVNGDEVKNSLSCKGECKSCKKEPHLVKTKNNSVKYCYEYFINLGKLISDSEKKGPATSKNRVISIHNLPRHELAALTTNDIHSDDIS